MAMKADAVTGLLADLRDRRIELLVQGERLRYRPKAAMTPELAERVKRHKPELLAFLAGDAGVPAEGRIQSHADREIRRFLRVAVLGADGRSWYDPGSLPDAAGRAYVAYTLQRRGGRRVVDNRQVTGQDA